MNYFPWLSQCFVCLMEYFSPQSSLRWLTSQWVKKWHVICDLSNLNQGLNIDFSINYYLHSLSLFCLLSRLSRIFFLDLAKMLVLYYQALVLPKFIILQKYAMLWKNLKVVQVFHRIMNNYSLRCWNTIAVDSIFTNRMNLRTYKVW